MNSNPMVPLELGRVGMLATEMNLRAQNNGPNVLMACVACAYKIPQPECLVPCCCPCCA